MPTFCSVSDEIPVSDSCPSSEWQTVLTWFRLTNNAIPDNYLGVTDGIDPSPDAVAFTGNTSLRQFYLEDEYSWNLDDANNASLAFSATTQQSTIADALINTAAIWADALDFVKSVGFGVSPADEQSAVHTINEAYYQPYSTAKCVIDSILAKNDTRPVAFPAATPFHYDTLPHDLQSSLHHINGVLVIDDASVPRAQLLDIDGPEWTYRIAWFELPSSYFNVSALGAVILLPAIYNDRLGNAGQNIVVCNLIAGWGLSSINTTLASEGLSAVDSFVKNDESVSTHDDLGKVPGTTSRTFVDKYQGNINVRTSFLLPQFPQRIITIGKDWAKYLNPRLPAANTTVLDYMMTTFLQNDTTLVVDYLAEEILGSLLVNGLARIGFDRQLQGDLKLTSGPNGTSTVDGTYWVSGKGDIFTVDPVKSKDWLKLRVDSTIEGYAYNTRGTGPKVAIAFLLAYCALALTCTMYAGISGS